MNLTNHKMTVQCLTRIEVLQAHQNAIQAALHCVRERCPQDQVQSDLLFSRLNELELQEWRNLFMWALTLEDGERDRIKAAAHERFLSDGHSVSHWLNNGVTPGSWVSADEDAFREMARKAFAPKSSVDIRE